MATTVILGTALGWLELAALASLAGGLAFAPLLLRSPKAQPLRETTRLARRRWLLISLIAAAGLSVLAVLPGTSATEFPVERRAGVLVVRFLLCAVIAWAWLRQREESPWLLAPAALLLLTQSLLSRSAALTDWLAPALADWFHLILASVWLGGVVLLAVALVPRVVSVSSDGMALMPALEAVLERFSPLAMFCVLGLGISGIAQSANFLRGFDQLLTTDYGRALSAKLVLFVVLIGFGALHQQVIMPRLRAWRLKRGQAAASAAARKFRVSLLAETAAGAALLLAVGLMKALVL
jgi:putative copper export protein